MTETISTIQFAERVKTIKNKAKVNEELDEAQIWKKKYNELLERLKTENNSLIEPN